MDLFKELGEILRPENSLLSKSIELPEFITVTAYLSKGKKVEHALMKDWPAHKIQLFLTETYGDECWSWDKLK
jgi:hypothetical protein